MEGRETFLAVEARHKTPGHFINRNGPVLRLWKGMKTAGYPFYSAYAARRFWKGVKTAGYPFYSAYAARRLRRVGCFSLLRASSLSWRTRSRLMPSRLPIC